MSTDIKELRITDIARLVRNDWAKVYFGAEPYLAAMQSIYTDDQNYGADSAKSIVLYFLSNASTWRGDVARSIKAELKRRYSFK